ncbi:echinoderm microtubule-associated protein-like 1 [Pimephales promelas]|uniref:echinoderm microtubule-associated protein-like 1 n=1 Tax=Pimephales promelas TaxID=90988 RepID=UPI0019556902|nr:echinoderm microtubule-associated protein-like 1 [Pimephales promelas]
MEVMEVLTEAGGASHSGGFNSECLLPPDTDFMTDERCSPQLSDRLSLLEQRVQMQDDQIQLLKMAMADVLKRLHISEEQTTSLGSRAPVKASAGRAASLVSLRKNSSSTLPSSPSSRTCSPRSGTEIRTPGTSARARPTDRTLQDTKPKEASASGSKRVARCKVTLQIYLVPLGRGTGSAEECEVCEPVDQSRSAAVTAVVQRKKSSSLNNRSPVKPVKPASQYFQICY